MDSQQQLPVDVQITHPWSSKFFIKMIHYNSERVYGEKNNTCSCNKRIYTTPYAKEAQNRQDPYYTVCRPT